jgi:hypothetical protein
LDSSKTGDDDDDDDDDEEEAEEEDSDDDRDKISRDSISGSEAARFLSKLKNTNCRAKMGDPRTISSAEKFSPEPEREREAGARGEDE